MIRLTLLCLVLVGVALADHQYHEPGCCTAGDRKVIQKEWKTIWKDVESVKVKAGVAKLLLLKLIETYPEAKALFKGVNIDNPKSGEFTAHCLRIMNALDMIINLLDDPDALHDVLDHLAHQHEVRTGVKQAYFKKFAELVLGGLPKVLDTFNSMSWKACFRGIFHRIADRLPA